ncbi:uncharacterized protein LOC143195196 [Rhynchophorus ferrugineus]|uniref:uncharacterized protein LOC143195196 n=1 Tax=Rhynchophorus ferrugineus TaxID=354439 RepID=UPI003FCE9345
MILPIIIIYFNLIQIYCIWPPAYKVNLKYEEEFVISELLQKSDIEDVYDDEEMIQNSDMKARLKKNANKYYGLHRQATRFNKRKDKIEGNDSNDISVNFVDKNPNISSVEKNEADNMPNYEYDNQYIDDEEKSNKTNSHKIEERSINDTAQSNYDYDVLKAQYEDSVNKAQNKNDTAKYQEVKEEESPAEAAKSLVTFEKRNCTEEEKKGFGIATLQCFWIKFHNKQTNQSKQSYVIKKALLIILIWIVVYLLIALPLWCQYGWCCCCCRCKFCQPRDEIEDIKRFFICNPPGVYHDEKDNTIKYQSTNHELYSQKKLEKAIQRL